MKIITKTVRSISCGSGPRAPSKLSSFEIINRSKKSCSQEKKFLTIPCNDSCPTEMTGSKCLASSLVRLSKKMAEKMEIKTIHCKKCCKNPILSVSESRKICCKIAQEKFSKLCIFASDSKCPRVSQLESWLIKCRYMRNKMKKCTDHRLFVINLKKEIELERIIVNKILL